MQILTAPSSYIDLAIADEGVRMILAARSNTDYRLRGERAPRVLVLNNMVSSGGDSLGGRGSENNRKLSWIHKMRLDSKRL